MPRQSAAHVDRSSANPSALLDHLALDPANINAAEREVLMAARSFRFLCLILEVSSLT